MPIKEYLCKYCKEKFSRESRHEKRSRNIFCSLSCKSKHQSVYSPIFYKHSRSKIEESIYKEVREFLPGKWIIKNTRKVLPSKLEFDIWIPSIKLAIEVNGPTHYKPIYGEERFQQAKSNDLIKKAESKQEGIVLISIDVGSDIYKRKFSDVDKEARHLFKRYLKRAIETRINRIQEQKARIVSGATPLFV